MVTLSIIIPVYNIEDYLPRCVDSILTQTYQDLELLLINDGSTDKSGEICDNYAKKDSRVRVFHQVNAGVSAARNAGLENAQGNWIAFVDGDDWIEKDSLSKIMNSYQDNEIDIIYARSFVNNERAIGEERYSFPSSYSNQIYDGVVTAIQKNYMRGSVCGTIFSQKLLSSNKIKFPLGLKNGEDSIFSLITLIYAEKVGFVNNHYYNVYEREGSASRNWTFDRVFHMINNVKYLNNYTKNNESLSSEALSLLDLSKYGVVSNIYNNFHHCFSISGFIKLTKSLKKELRGKLKTGDIKSRKGKVKLLNFSTTLFGLSVVINAYFRELKK